MKPSEFTSKTDSFAKPVASIIPDVQRTFIQATYHATESDWKIICRYLRDNKQGRLAGTIERGIKRQIETWSWIEPHPDFTYGIRVKHGSVWQMEEILKKIESSVHSSNPAALWGEPEN